METQRDADPPELEEGSVVGSVWSGDGTSASESSDNESVVGQVVAKEQKRRGATQGASDGPNQGKPSLLLIGDGNASGSHETRPSAASLGNYLSAQFSVVVAGNARASWRTLEKSASDLVAKGVPKTARKDNFDFILVVLGALGIPSQKQCDTMAWAAKAIELSDLMLKGIRCLQGYLGPAVSPSRVVVSQVFNFEENRSVDALTDLLRAAARAAGAHFLEVPWDKATHAQSKAPAADKYFNAAGIRLLGDLVLSLAEAPVPVTDSRPPAEAPAPVTDSRPPVSGASSRAAPSSRRLPTLRVVERNDSSASRSDSSSSSSSSRACEPRVPSEDKVCEACQTRNHHSLDYCPLVFAAMFDGDVEAAKSALENLGAAYRPRAQACPYKRYQRGSFAKFRCPGDGNCLFTAFGVGMVLAQGKRAPDYGARANYGRLCRQRFLCWTRASMEKDVQIGELSLKVLLLDSGRWSGSDEYLHVMGAAITQRRQWGGFAEASVLAHMCKVKLYLFVSYEDGSVALQCEPVQPPGSTASVCLMYSGAHYDSLSMEPAALAEATQLA